MDDPRRQQPVTLIHDKTGEKIGLVTHAIDRPGYLVFTPDGSRAFFAEATDTVSVEPGSQAAIVVERTGRIYSYASVEFEVTYPNGTVETWWSPPWQEIDYADSAQDKAAHELAEQRWQTFQETGQWPSDTTFRKE
jgi:hypothetical protein